MSRSMDGPIPNIERLLDDSSWLNTLARSLVLDESQADDVVQEAWLSTIRRPPPLLTRAWLAGVVRNLARLTIRRDSLRKRHERHAARSESDGRIPAHTLERIELQRKVIDLVMGLEDPYRSTILLRYFEEMSTRQVARHQGVPDATVRSRLQRGLGMLRARLDRLHGGHRQAWCLVLAPWILGEALSPASAAAGGATGPLAAEASRHPAQAVLGGLVMSKKIVVSLAVSASLLFTIALGIGAHWNGSAGPTAGGEDGTAEKRARRLLEDLKGGNEASVERIRILSRGRAALLATVEAERKRNRELEARLSERDAGTVLAAGEPGIPAEAGEASADIDWKRLGELVRKNIALFGKVSELIGEGKKLEEHLSTDQLAFLREFQAEWAKAGAQAMQVRNQPFLDREILPELLKTVFGASDILTAEQVDRVVTAGVDFLEERGDLQEITPLQALSERKKLVADLLGAVDASVPDSQRERWTQLDAGTKALLEGEHGRSQIGLKVDDQQNIDRILTFCKAHYGFGPELEDTARQLCSEYLEGAKGVVQRHGNFDLGVLQEDAGKRALVEKDFLSLQLAFEEKIVGHLSTEQWTALLKKPANLFCFSHDWGGGAWNVGTAGF